MRNPQSTQIFAKNLGLVMTRLRRLHTFEVNREMSGARRCLLEIGTTSIHVSVAYPLVHVLSLCPRCSNFCQEGPNCRRRQVSEHVYDSLFLLLLLLILLPLLLLLSHLKLRRRQYTRWKTS